MSAPHLHIVSFNVPWPADYGGVIDVMCRIKALHEMGVKIHLHCYTYGRTEAKELDCYCEEVCYYKRETTPIHLLSNKPYIVASRCSRALKDRLLADKYPILLEGLHCCWLLEEIRKEDQNRTIFVRTHNIEHDYYKGLHDVEKNVFKRLFFASESRKLKRYESTLRLASGLLTITEKDRNYFEHQRYDVLYVPTPWNDGKVRSKVGKGDYCLYHGNLSVGENDEAARYLISQVVPYLECPLVIAGKDPSEQLKKMAEGRVRLVANPNETEMQSLVSNAHVIVMITQQATGLKLKLINSLYEGRFCVVNRAMVEGTGLENICEVQDKAQDQANVINQLMHKDFSEDDIITRQDTLNHVMGVENLTNFVKRL